MKFRYRILADAIFVLHFFVVLGGLFGWMFPSLWYLYIVGLIATLLSDAVLGYCILSKWEFDLRRKIHPELEYDYAWATYYTYKITNHRIPNRLYYWSAILFLVVSLAVQVMIHT